MKRIVFIVLVLALIVGLSLIITIRKEKPPETTISIYFEELEKIEKKRQLIEEEKKRLRDVIRSELERDRLLRGN
jgi:uncharacterized membrane protein